MLFFGKYMFLYKKCKLNKKKMSTLLLCLVYHVLVHLNLFFLHVQSDIVKIISCSYATTRTMLGINGDVKFNIEIYSTNL